MKAFAARGDAATAPPQRPVFVALNATFDRMSVADYLDRYVGRNPPRLAPPSTEALPAPPG